MVLAKKGKLERFNFRKDYWDGYWGQGAIMSLRKSVVARRTSTGSGSFSPRISPYSSESVLLIKCLYSYKDDLPKNLGKLPPKNKTSPLPVDVRCSKMSLLTLRTGASPETIPEFLAKVNSAKSFSRFLSGEFSFFLPHKG